MTRKIVAKVAYFVAEGGSDEVTDLRPISLSERRYPVADLDHGKKDRSACIP